jgi:hypothetical protein
VAARNGQIGFVDVNAPHHLLTECMGPPIASHPVFDGNRMYLRSRKRENSEVLCIAVTSEPGRQLVERTIAETYVSNRPLTRPAAIRYVAPAPIPEFVPDGRAPVYPCNIQTAPSDWLFAGPFPRRAGEEPLAAIGGPSNAVIAAGTRVTYAGETRSFEPLPARFVLRHHAGWTKAMRVVDVYSERVVLDRLGPTGKTPHTVIYFYAVLDNREPRFVRFKMQTSSGLTAWIGNRKVEPYSVVKLDVGYYRFLIRSEFGRIPPFNWTFIVCPYLVTMTDPNRQLTEWVARIREDRPIIKRIMRELPGSAHARRVGHWLERADGFSTRSMEK